MSKEAKAAADTVDAYLENLRQQYGEKAVEATRIALGVPLNELRRKDEAEFQNTYDLKIAKDDSNPFQSEYIPADLSPRLRQKKHAMWEQKRILHVEAMEGALTLDSELCIFLMRLK